MRKKAQFGPDALVGMVVVALIGLGGIWFLSTFVQGLTIEGLISVLDQEIDQRCFFMTLPLTGDEYIRVGQDVSDNVDLTKMKDYFGGERRYMEKSAEFEAKLNNYVEKIKVTPLGQRPTYIKGFIATQKASEDLGNQITDEIDDQGLTITQLCLIPIYNPAGQIGVAQVFVAEDSEACGTKDKPCCVGEICDPGLNCWGGVCYE
jgi:hypothetical protein